MLNKSEGTIQNRQSKNMGNIAYTRYRTKSNKARTNKKKQHRKKYKDPDILD